VDIVAKALAKAGYQRTQLGATPRCKETLATAVQSGGNRAASDNNANTHPESLFYHLDVLRNRVLKGHKLLRILI
jgi:hypothetical protein